jgi:hypothetical protein
MVTAELVSLYIHRAPREIEVFLPWLEDSAVHIKNELRRFVLSYEVPYIYQRVMVGYVLLSVLGAEFRYSEKDGRLVKARSTDITKEELQRIHTEMHRNFDSFPGLSTSSSWKTEYPKNLTPYYDLWLSNGDDTTAEAQKYFQAEAKHFLTLAASDLLRMSPDDLLGPIHSTLQSVHTNLDGAFCIPEMGVVRFQFKQDHVIFISSMRPLNTTTPDKLIHTFLVKAEQSFSDFKYHQYIPRKIQSRFVKISDFNWFCESKNDTLSNVITAAGLLNLFGTQKFPKLDATFYSGFDCKFSYSKTNLVQAEVSVTNSDDKNFELSITMLVDKVELWVLQLGVLLCINYKLLGSTKVTERLRFAIPKMAQGWFDRRDLSSEGKLTVTALDTTTMRPFEQRTRAAVTAAWQALAEDLSWKGDTVRSVP